MADGADSPVQIEQLTIGADPAVWADAGFSVVGDRTGVGATRIEFGRGEGILGWRLTGTGATGVDGLPDVPRAEATADADVDPHPNGVTRIDHIVVFTPDLERTTRALERIGVERRRVREADSSAGMARQGFFRLGEVILEIVEHPRVEPGAARFWGITFAVADLDACAELLGERLGSIHHAVQAGRRIATVRDRAGLGLPVALISAPG
jgi:hypothetical protein